MEVIPPIVSSDSGVGGEGEDHPRGFLEAWQQQKAKERRQSDSRRPNNENGDSVKNILQVRICLPHRPKTYSGDQI